MFAALQERDKLALDSGFLVRSHFQNMAQLLGGSALG
jgi:hypothetical protein